MRKSELGILFSYLIIFLFSKESIYLHIAHTIIIRILQIFIIVFFVWIDYSLSLTISSTYSLFMLSTVK